MKNLALIFTVLACMSCSSNKEVNEMALEVDLMAVPPTSSANEIVVGPADSSVARKLVKEGFLKFETSDVQETRNRLMNAVGKTSAYVSLDQESRSPERVSYTLEIKIPHLQFDTFLNSATKNVTYFDEKRINVSDITAEYVDTEIRLKAKKEIEARYLQLLARASSVKDVLSIEKEAEESAEGQLKLFKD